MQMYGCFDGFPLFLCLVWVGNIMTPVCGPLSLFVDNVRRCYDPCCNFSIHLVTPLPFFCYDFARRLPFYEICT